VRFISRIRVRIRMRVRIRFSVWLVSCCAHVICATLGCNCHGPTEKAILLNSIMDRKGSSEGWGLGFGYYLCEPCLRCVPLWSFEWSHAVLSKTPEKASTLTFAELGDPTQMQLWHKLFARVSSNFESS